MGEVAGSDGEFDRLSADGCDGSGDDDGRVADWEVGLPSGKDLTPLSKALVPPVIASAFRVNPEPIRTALDVHRASQYTIANLRRAAPSAAAAAALRSFSPFPPDESESVAFEADGPVDEGAASGRILRSGPVWEEAESSASQPPDESESLAFEADGPVDEGAASGRILRSGPVLEEAESSASQPNDSCDDASERNPKRPRLAWTPQLHKRFVDVVGHLGIKNAVPKAIMQLMNVEGLTRENVASHLQKYRLYLKRMQGIPDAAASPSEHHLFASMPPATKSLRDKHMLTPLPYPLPGMISMPIFGMAPPPCWCDGPIGMVQLPGVNCQGDGVCHSYEQHHSDVAFKRG